MSKCLGCHHNLDRGYLFCSFTCAALCGYYNVKTGWTKLPKNITQKEIDKFLNNPPIRGNYPDKDKHL